MLPSWTSLTAADLVGAAALTFSCLWPLMKRRRSILVGQAAANLLFTTHYILLGAHTAAALCVLVLTQILAALPERRGWWQKVAFGVTIPGIALVAGATWSGLPTVLSALGISFSTMARWQSDTRRMRWFLLGAGAFWVSHNILVMSPFAIAADVMAAAGNITRLWADRRKAEPATVSGGLAAA